MVPKKARCAFVTSTFSRRLVCRRCWVKSPRRKVPCQLKVATSAISLWASAFRQPREPLKASRLRSWKGRFKSMSLVGIAFCCASHDGFQCGPCKQPLQLIVHTSSICLLTSCSHYALSPDALLVDHGGHCEFVQRPECHNWVVLLARVLTRKKFVCSRGASARWGAQSRTVETPTHRTWLRPSAAA